MNSITYGFESRKQESLKYGGFYKRLCSLLQCIPQIIDYNSLSNIIERIEAFNNIMHLEGIEPT